MQASVVVALGLQRTGSIVVVHGLSHPVACGIFPDQGLNPCPLIGRQILYHQGSPNVIFGFKRKITVRIYILNHPLFHQIVNYYISMIGRRKYRPLKKKVKKC